MTSEMKAILFEKDEVREGTQFVDMIVSDEASFVLIAKQNGEKHQMKDGEMEGDLYNFTNRINNVGFFQKNWAPEK